MSNGGLDSNNFGNTLIPIPSDRIPDYPEADNWTQRYNPPHSDPAYHEAAKNFPLIF